MTVEWELLTQEVIDVLEVGDPVWVVLNETCEKHLRQSTQSLKAM